MWEHVNSAAGGLAAIGLLTAIFIGAAIYATRDSDLPPEDPRGPWVLLDEVLAIISHPRWSWTRNVRCKYLSIRVDTRASRPAANLCRVYDRYGVPVTLDEIRFQERRRWL